MTADLKPVTWQQAADAIESLDDCARMTIGVDASGPRETLYRFLEQCKRAQSPAEAHGEALVTRRSAAMALNHLANNSTYKPEALAYATSLLVEATQANVQPKGTDDLRSLKRMCWISAKDATRLSNTPCKAGNASCLTTRPWKRARSCASSPVRI